MRIRSIIVGLVAIVVAGCNSSGNPTFAPGPTPSPTPQSARPAAEGDSFSYVGTLVQNFTRNPEPGVPVPTPAQTNSQTFTSAVTQQVAVTAGAKFNGGTGFFDFKTTESDAQESPSKTLGITTDAYFSFPAFGPTGRVGNVTQLGSSSTTTDGATFLTTYRTGNGLVDVLPEVAGPIGTPNNAAMTVKETDPDGQVTTRTTNADGSYVETATYPTGQTGTATENADGTGVYSFPLFGAPTNTTFTVGPVTGGAIPITIVYAAGLADVGPVTVNRSITPVWYPTTPPVLSKETYVNSGATAVPTACNVPATFGTSGNQLVQTIVKVDTIFGEVDTLTTTTYTILGVGVACIQLSDVVNQYYDFSGQTFRAIGTFATPIQVSTTTETVGLTAETLNPEESDSASVRRPRHYRRAPHS